MTSFFILGSIIFGLIGTTVAQHFFGTGLGFAVGYFLIGTPLGWVASKGKFRS